MEFKFGLAGLVNVLVETFGKSNKQCLCIHYSFYEGALRSRNTRKIHFLMHELKEGTYRSVSLNYMIC